MLKQRFYSELHEIKNLEQKKIPKLYNLINKMKDVFLTYNEIMKYYEHIQESDQNNAENSNVKIEYIFVCNKDLKNVHVFQHLPLFCEHFNIKLFGLPEGSRKVIENILNRRFVLILGIKKNDLVYEEIKKLLEE